MNLLKLARPLAVALTLAAGAVLLPVGQLAQTADAAGGCGSRGGPGYRLPNGKCASWADAARSGRVPVVPPAPAPPMPAPMSTPAPSVRVPLPESPAVAAPALGPGQLVVEGRTVRMPVDLPASTPRPTTLAGLETLYFQALDANIAAQQADRDRLGNAWTAFHTWRMSGSELMAEVEYQLIQRQRRYEAVSTLAVDSERAGLWTLQSLAIEYQLYLNGSLQFVKDERAYLATGANPGDAQWPALEAQSNAVGARFEQLRARYAAYRNR